MEYETFLQAVREELEALAGPEFTVTMQRVPKNNGVLLDGLCVGKAAENISPTVYLNSYYEQYREGMTMEEIIRDITKLCFNREGIPDACFHVFSDLEEVRGKIVYRLINAESNREFLADIPYIPFLDLAVVFYLFLSEDENGQITAMIHNAHLETWNLSLQELYDLAAENTPNLFPARIKSMKDVMKEIAKEHMGKNYREEFIDGLLDGNSGAPPLFVLSNASGINGACCLLYNQELEDFAVLLNADLIVLPSSIHEVLLIPKNPDISYEHLGAMVAEINRCEVPVEDRLSNQIYLYSRAEHSLSVAFCSFAPIGAVNPANQ